MTIGGLTPDEVERLEDLFSPPVLREMLAAHARSKNGGGAGRLGLFVHLNGRGEPAEYETFIPARVKRQKSA